MSIIDTGSPCDERIENFDDETMGVCGAMIKQHDEMTETEAIKKNYRDGRVPIVNDQTNERGYM
jgi:hypothetical protein